jgi:hypothetical protein
MSNASAQLQDLQPIARDDAEDIGAVHGGDLMLSSPYQLQRLDRLRAG